MKNITVSSSGIITSLFVRNYILKQNRLKKKKENLGCHTKMKIRPLLHGTK